MQLDLNLLTALDALLDEGSVGAAATRLGLSQPAMSRTLGRIREATGDQILVRAGRAMLPTPYAISVRDEVHALVAQGQALLRPAREVDPATLDRTFTLRCNDAVIDATGPILLTTIRAEAPGVRVRFLAETAEDTDDLRLDRVDLAVSAGEPTQPDVRHEVVGSGTLLAVVRAKHPLKALTLADYAAAEHVIVSRRGRLRDPIDDVLAAHGLSRRVLASAPTATAALRLVATTDLVAAVPALLAGAGLAAAGLRAFPLPLDLAPIPLVARWHVRYDGDPAHAWLRTRVRHALKAAGVPRFRHASE